MKITHAAVAVLGFAATLGAQQPAATQANPVTAAFRGRIAGLQHNVAQAIDSIPESKFGFRPTPAQLSIGFIAQHVASDNYLFCNTFGAMKAQIPASETSTPDSVKARWPKDSLVAQLAASFAFCDKAMSQLEDGKLGQAATLSFEGRTFNTTVASMVLGHALDLADHYSQLANYMRLNGILPPTALPRPRRAGN